MSYRDLLFLILSLLYFVLFTYSLFLSLSLMVFLWIPECENGGSLCLYLFLVPFLELFPSDYLFCPTRKY